jgi:hypothetical protein
VPVPFCIKGADYPGVTVEVGDAVRKERARMIAQVPLCRGLVLEGQA